MSGREYRNKPEYQGHCTPIFGLYTPKSDYLDKIAGMSDAELYEETKEKILALASSKDNPYSDFPWQADACYDEWMYRGKGKKYQQAWQHVSRNI